ncbi:hypothetical protein Pyrde_1075 [Pyrodictium delaneyi]|uniref:Uncharacterized protein n=1 Tax=Pyrodictium delaneyi TaxID=1273541 RepID=A0A0P0N3Z4_9CREN|nr:hypothetical protein [Pyrodictium delaneyi]ALL01123.1 hypothetical protein Pyrde_1075 [Pyrodictium delaneyi]OWJ55298.1 hypothetical protein Pdsh_00265 [Pyrodictium delaneyi]
MVETTSPLMRGIAIFNAILIPLAIIALYMVYIGGTRDKDTILFAGIVLTTISPLLAYIVTSRLVAKIIQRTN